MTTFIRVKDPSTGHEFDLPEGHPHIGPLVKPVKSDRYPPSPFPRRAKFHKSPADLAGPADSPAKAEEQDTGDAASPDTARRSAGSDQKGKK